MGTVRIAVPSSLGAVVAMSVCHRTTCPVAEPLTKRTEWGNVLISAKTLSAVIVPGDVGMREKCFCLFVCSCIYLFV